MALENANFLDGLDLAWPATGDQTAQGDDHIRLLKLVLKQTFPGLAGEFGRVVMKGANYTPALTENHCHFISSAALTVTLGALSGLPTGTTYKIKAGVGTTTIVPNAADTIDGLASLALPVGSFAVLVKRDTNIWGAFITTPSPSLIPAGTNMIFAQAAAPTGWTQVVTDAADNRMLRVTKLTGGGVAGTHSPILNNVVPAHTHGFSTGAVSADHVHSGNTGGRSAAHTHEFSIVKGRDGAGGSANTGAYEFAYTSGTATYSSGTELVDHSHGFSTNVGSATHSHSGSTDNGSSQVNWAPRYIDTIICTKN